MSEIQYDSLIWLYYRLAATFAFGLPIVLLVWSAAKKESAIFRLMSIYWKVSSLLIISILLLTNNQRIGILTAFISAILIAGSIWFWVDLNEELDEMPKWKALPLTTKIWRWALTFLCFGHLYISTLTLNCFTFFNQNNCLSWTEDPKNLHRVSSIVMKFLFGGEWTQGLAGFVGYASLIIYAIGLIQWLLIRFPKQGRIAGEF